MRDVITRKEFDEGTFEGFKSRGLKSHRVYLLLKTNKDSAFSVKGIVKKTGMKVWAVRSIIGKLKKAKLIIHKSPYYSIK